MARRTPFLLVCLLSLTPLVGNLSAREMTLYSNGFNSLVLPNLPPGWFTITYTNGTNPLVTATATAASVTNGVGGSTGVKMTAVFTAAPWDAPYWQYGAMLFSDQFAVTNSETNLNKLAFTMDVNPSQTNLVQVILRSADTNGTVTGSWALNAYAPADTFTTIGGPLSDTNKWSVGDGIFNPADPKLLVVVHIWGHNWQNWGSGTNWVTVDNYRYTRTPPSSGAVIIGR
jgi:hypothetical protein